MHHATLNRSGTHDRDLDYEIVEIARLETRQHRLLGARLDLEYTDRVGAPDHRVDGGVLSRNVLHPQRRLALRRHHVERTVDCRKHPERQAIDLEQSDGVEVVLVPLNDGALGHCRVLDRDHPLERIACDDEAADVLRQVAGETEQVAGQRDRAANDRMARIESRLVNAIGVDGTPVPPCERARQPVELGGLEPQRAADVAHGTLRAVGDERRGKRRAVTSVLAEDVLHHFLASLVLEIDIDVGRLIALAADEALEQHRTARRIDLGDAERIANGGIGGRAASLAQDVLRARECNDVVDGEEVRLVAQLGDQRELALDLRAHVGRDQSPGRITFLLLKNVIRPGLYGPGFRVATGEPRFDEAAQPRRRRLPGRHDFLWILIAQIIE